MSVGGCTPARAHARTHTHTEMFKNARQCSLTFFLLIKKGNRCKPIHLHINSPILFHLIVILIFFVRSSKYITFIKENLKSQVITKLNNYFLPHVINNKMHFSVNHFFKKKKKSFNTVLEYEN